MRVQFPSASSPQFLLLLHIVVRRGASATADALGNLTNYLIERGNADNSCSCAAVPGGKIEDNASSSLPPRKLWSRGE